jgi:glyoxylase-like metal-dependent hydrolase (beta-lactamase superfamily II)
MSRPQAQRMARRRFLAGTAADAIALGTGTLVPSRPGWANARPVYRSGDLEALVVSDGHSSCRRASWSSKNHFSRITDKVVMVREGYEIVSGVHVLDTPGHTPGHISVEVAGGDGLVIAGDALTHVLISFQHPSWKVPVDHDADRGISTRLRLLDRLATDKRRLVAAHLPFPGTGFVERKDRTYRFVAN